jgi:hypothetical protein
LSADIKRNNLPLEGKKMKKRGLVLLYVIGLAIMLTGLSGCASDDWATIGEIIGGIEVPTYTPDK